MFIATSISSGNENVQSGPVFEAEADMWIESDCMIALNVATITFKISL